MPCLTVIAHPPGWQARGFTWADVPFFSGERGGPRTPRFRRVVDAEAAGKTGVVTRENLTPEVSFQACVKSDAGAKTACGMRNDGRTMGNFWFVVKMRSNFTSSTLSVDSYTKISVKAV